MEFWDIYDENKKPTGRTMKRNDWCLKDGEYHLTVLGVVGRPDGTFLITKRVMTKAWAPGWWEVSGGAAQAGEESCEAVLREVKEETGLDVRNAEGGYMFTYKRENPGEGDNYFVDVYRFVMDIDESDLHLQTEETDGYMFATVDEIKAFAAEGKFLHPPLVNGGLAQSCLSNAVRFLSCWVALLPFSDCLLRCSTPFWSTLFYFFS